MKSRIVVLGANGFIGRRVMHVLSQTDWAEPVAVSRQASAGASGAGASGAAVIVADVSKPEELRRAITGAAGVVNCIAGSPALIVAATRTLFEAAALLSPPRRIVHLSSLAAYGSASGLVDEDVPLRGDLDAYSAAKAESDRLAAQYPEVITLRPGIVYGPGSSWWSDRIARLLIRRRLGNLGNCGEGHCNLVFVDDVAEAAVRALRLEDPAPRAFNLSWGGPLTWNEYFSAYAGALSALPVRHISRARLALETRVVAPPFKVLERLLAAPRLARWNPLPPLPSWLVKLCGSPVRLDVTRAEHVLMMRWTPLSAGLQLTADWFLAGGRTAK